ncbi:sugar O-acetyltransferase [Pseudomonas sp. HS-18]|uniref:sugar O-acetyltransferase n=1 Tax=Pseudomonas sp. HS-18 TaxID=2879114 RepID=UPI00298F18D3|nr:sugar O-acetyltransferase [Pseudomonas sp. HS-18]
MNELEKAAAGLLYDANHDSQVLRQRAEAKAKLFDFNHSHPDDRERREAILTGLFGSIGEGFVIEGPLHCDYGFNIEIGARFYANVNLVILDGAKVSIGNDVFIAPNVGIYTAGHPLDAERRNQGLEYAHPVSIGDNVWIGANSVIGAGAVVVRDIPEGVLAAGNPARVIRPITEADRQRYR